MLDINRIRKSFTRASFAYEENATLQKRIGLNLLNSIRIKDIQPKRILDIGMGTGWFTDEVSRIYQADIFGIDSASGMVRHAKARKILKVSQAEAMNLPFKQQSFDLIVSNLTYQWVPDLARAFSESYRVAKAGSIFHFNCFAKDTLRELKLSFNSSSKEQDLFNAHEFPDTEKIHLALQESGFKEISLETKKYYEYFDDLFLLLKWLKLIGANCLRRPKFIKRDLFHKAADFYQGNFRENGKVFATFDVIEAKAIKK